MSLRPERGGVPPPSFPQGPFRNDSALADDTPTEIPGTPVENPLSPPMDWGAPPLTFSEAHYNPPSPPARYVPIPDEEAQSFFDGDNFYPDKPPIPSALPQASQPYATPLPKISMVVLSIVMLGEFLCANVSTPFILFMVDGFGVGTEAEVGYWTGLLVSSFFVTQFFTSLLWATAADQHGRRAVLFISLLGNTLTVLLFGTSTTLSQAVAIRLLQGVFNGAVGVARGTVAGITDGTNEARAYAIMGFSWGLGGVAGAIVGGSFESPAKKWPGVFGNVPLFNTYPYLLPCAIAGSVTLVGAVLSLFLDWDGGPREGAIHLPGKETAVTTSTTAEPEASSPIDLGAPPVSDPSPNTGSIVGNLGRSVSKKFSGYFARRVLDAQGGHSPASASPRVGTVPMPAGSHDNNGAGAAGKPKGRTFSRSSRINGSAYGYGRSRLGSMASSMGVGVATGLRRGSMASDVRRRYGAGVVDNADVPFGTSVGTNVEGNFARRLLMANELAVNSMTDLWVAAAINADNANDDPFESDDEYDYEGDEEGGSVSSFSMPGTPLRRPRYSFSNRIAGPSARRPSNSRGGMPGSHPRGSMSHPAHAAPGSAFGTPQQHHRRLSFLISQGTPAGSRRPSSSSHMPSIYSNTGLHAPPALAGHGASPLSAPPVEGPSHAHIDAFAASSGLAPITESSRQASSASEATDSAAEEGVFAQPHVQAQAQTQTQEVMSEKGPSMREVPLVIIFQYFILALHNTIHDQIFLLYLVSPYRAGGLGLNAAHFAQLIALMCGAQIAYQFYLYPNLGPPRGRFSHLAMFRVGSALFIPSYLSVTLYRVFASPSEDGNLLVMTLLAISTAVRYCGTTFTYTSVAILLNYMSPPHVVSMSNGLAQSMVSLARFLGPVLGGWLWSLSVEKSPSGYPLGFYICSFVCFVAIMHSFMIR